MTGGNEVPVNRDDEEHVEDDNVELGRPPALVAIRRVMKSPL